MALKDVFGFFKEGLAEQFSVKPRDAEAARRPLLRGIDKTLEQFQAGRSKAPHRWWEVNNGVVAFSPKIKGVPLVLNSGTTNHVSVDDFPTFLANFRDAVEQGELDAELQAIETNSSLAGHSVAVEKTTRRGGISPEAAKARGIKAAESRARNKAAREAGGQN